MIPYWISYSVKGQSPATVAVESLYPLDEGDTVSVYREGVFMGYLGLESQEGNANFKASLVWEKPAFGIEVISVVVV